MDKLVFEVVGAPDDILDGINKGFTVGLAVDGFTVETVGLLVGQDVGSKDGTKVGIEGRAVDGDAVVGSLDWTVECNIVGLRVGIAVGVCDGLEVVGTWVGFEVGDLDGRKTKVGLLLVGANDGLVGLNVGKTEGSSDNGGPNAGGNSIIGDIRGTSDGSWDLTYVIENSKVIKRKRNHETLTSDEMLIVISTQELGVLCSTRTLFIPSSCIRYQITK